jgi:hypothetical protein
MPQTIPAMTLLATQTRMINATEGFRLEVLSGCLWLTRPGDAVDRFLVAGASIELHENQVLIQSDRHPGAQGLEAARYALVPLAAAISRASKAMPASDKSSVAKLAWLAPSACLFMERR